MAMILNINGADREFIFNIFTDKKLMSLPSEDKFYVEVDGQQIEYRNPSMIRNTLLANALGTQSSPIDQKIALAKFLYVMQKGSTLTENAFLLWLGEQPQESIDEIADQISEQTGSVYGEGLEAIKPRQ